MKQKEKEIQLQLPLHSAVGDPNDDLNQRVKEMKQTLDRVVNELEKMKVQLGDRDVVAVPSQVSNQSPALDLGRKGKMQIVLDVSVVVGVLVGVLLGVGFSQMMK